MASVYNFKASLSGKAWSATGFGDKADGIEVSGDNEIEFTVALKAAVSEKEPGYLRVDKTLITPKRAYYCLMVGGAVASGGGGGGGGGGGAAAAAAPEPEPEEEEEEEAEFDLFD